MVRYDAAMTPALRQCHAQALGAEIVDAKVVLPGLQKLLLPPGRSVEGAVKALQELGSDYVEYALPNTLVEPRVAPELPNDPLVPRTWTDPDKQYKFWWLWSGAQCKRTWRNLWLFEDCTYRGIGAVDAWNTWTGDRNFRLGIIDHGFDDGAVNDFGYNPPVENGNFAGLAARVDVLPAQPPLPPRLGTLREPPGVCRSDKWRWSGTQRKYICTNSDVDSDHGTMVGLYAAALGNNNILGSGVMQRAAIVPVQVVPQNMNTEALLKAMNWLARADGGNARVVNVSLGLRGSDNTADVAIEDRVFGDIMARHPDTLWVWAAGNDAFNTDTRGDSNTYLPYSSSMCKGSRWTLQSEPGDDNRPPPPNPGQKPPDMTNGCNRRSYLAGDAPCRLRTIGGVQLDTPVIRELGRWQDVDIKQGRVIKKGVIGGNRGNMICVAANDINGQLASSSNYGRKTVEFSAPGEGMVAPYTGLDPAKRGGLSDRLVSGTSFAAPLVSGVAGLVRSKYPDLSAVQTKCVLMNAAARAPLPDQNIDKVTHPAFLQPQDKVNTQPAPIGRPVSIAADRDEGEGRLKANELLRVMGIPNAAFALEEAAKTALKQASGEGEGKKSCVEEDDANVTVTPEALPNGRVRVRWNSERPVKKVEAKFVERGKKDEATWEDVTPQPPNARGFFYFDSGKPVNKLAPQTDKRFFPRTLKVRVTTTDNAVLPIQSGTVWLHRLASGDFRLDENPGWPSCEDRPNTRNCRPPA